MKYDEGEGEGAEEKRNLKHFLKESVIEEVTLVTFEKHKDVKFTYTSHSYRHGNKVMYRTEGVR